MNKIILSPGQQATEDMFIEIKDLKAKLFNEQEHYKLLKENYDNVFKFIAKELKCDVDDAFEKYKEFLISGDDDE
jgi:hypothetical protein